MKAENLSYTREISVAVDIGIVYQALTRDIGKWWAPKSDVIHKVGDSATFQFPPTFWTMKAIRLIPDALIELECIEAYHIDDSIPHSAREEWLGTKLVWTLSSSASGTTIQFVHEGLTPQLVCYDVCEAGWDHFFVKELYAYLIAKKAALSNS